MKHIPVGTVVCVVAPGSRSSNGEERLIPAIVLKQWPDESLQLYSFHFEGVPLLMNSVSLDFVFGPGQPEPIGKSKARAFELSSDAA